MAAAPAPAPATVSLESGLTAVEPPFGWNPPPRDPYRVVPRKIEHNSYEGELLYRYRDSTYSGRPPTATERVPHRQRAQRVFRSDRGVQATHLTTFYRIPGSNEFIEIPAGSRAAIDGFMGIPRPPQTLKRSAAAAGGIGPNALDANYMTQLANMRYGRSYNAFASGNLNSLDVPHVRDFSGAGFSLRRRSSHPRLASILRAASACEKSTMAEEDGLAVSGTPAVLHCAVERSQKVDGAPVEQPPLVPTSTPAWRPPGIAQPPSHQPGRSLRTFRTRPKSSLGFVAHSTGDAISAGGAGDAHASQLATQGLAAAAAALMFAPSPMGPLMSTRSVPFSQRDRPRPKSAIGFFTAREASEEHVPVQELGRTTPGGTRVMGQKEQDMAQASERTLRPRPSRPATAHAVRSPEKAEPSTASLALAAGAPAPPRDAGSDQVSDQAPEGQAQTGTARKASRPKTAPTTRTSVQFVDSTMARGEKSAAAAKPPSTYELEAAAKKTSSTYELELEYGGTLRASGIEPVMRPAPAAAPPAAVGSGSAPGMAPAQTSTAAPLPNGMRVRPKSAAPALLGSASEHTQTAPEAVPPPPPSPTSASYSSAGGVGVSIQDGSVHASGRWEGRRAQSALPAATAVTTDMRGRQRTMLPVTTITFPAQEQPGVGRQRQSERPPRSYDEALRRYGWRMEVHNDPLNLKKPYLHPRYEYTMELSAPDAMPPAPGLTSENRDTFFYNTIPTTKLGEFTIAPDFASERFCEQRDRLRRTGKWKFSDKSFSFLY